ncbi:unnamed protein product [Gongylonema pulchrum]|uniref:Uncharacterized protein n=1 Tax=Gongylonema pulchrum TaxID=637853 RepID=A0A183E1X3_9BILA|nr:unnamed protein product [Gongylonema pulchrum]
MQISLRMRGVYLRVQGIALFRSSAAANVDLDARRPEGTERVKFVRSKPSDTFGTLRTFEEKLLPLKISERPKNRSTVCEIADENWEGSYEEEEIGWTPNYLRALRKEDTRFTECARKEYNHYEGMRYPAGDIQLASQYWIKSKYKNDWFTINPITKKVQFFITYSFFFT